jgi:hypothetical protein
MKLSTLVVAAGALLVALAFIHFSRRQHAENLPSAPGGTEAVDGDEVAQPGPPGQVSVLASSAVPLPLSFSNTVSITNWLLFLLTNNGEMPKLPREVIDRWLASGRTNAEDLLAARQAGGGMEFLRRALANFPNDPRVLFAASALDDGSEERRARLDRFQAAAPENALADYLSARDHLKNSRPEQALVDLLAASGKTHFQDYSLDAMQNAEELYLQAGKSAAEAKALATSTALLPHLAQLKSLAQEMGVLQRQYLAAGDGASAEQLAQMGLQLGQQLMDGEGSRTLISQLVGIAVERIVLNPLDPERNYNFLQGNTHEYVAQLDARRAGVRETTQLLDGWMRNASEADLISYFDRLKIYGESSAMAWLRQRQAVP